MNWTWEIMSEPTMNSRLAEREAGGWTVRSIVEAGRSDKDYYKVFMSLSTAVPAPPSKSAPTELPALEPSEEDIAWALLHFGEEHEQAHQRIMEVGTRVAAELSCRTRQLREALGIVCPPTPTPEP